MAIINVDDAYILNETGAQVDKTTGIPFKNENLTEAEAAQARANIRAGVAEQIFNTVTNVSSDTTVTLSEDVGKYSWIIVQFNTSSSNPSSTRYTMTAPVVIASGIAWYPLPNGESVRLTASGTSLRVVESTFQALYLIRVYGQY